MKLRAFVFLLGAVVLVHWSALTWLQGRMSVLKPMAPMADTMFTRLIEPVAPVAPVAAKPKPKRARAPAPAALPPVATAGPEPQPASAPDPTEPPTQDRPPQPDVVAQETAETPEKTPEDQATEPGPPAPAQAPPGGDGWPADTRLSYRLTGYFRGDLHGNGRVQWQRDQGRYQVRVDLSMAVVLRASMTSQGEVTDSGLVPRAYEEQLPAGSRRMTFEGGSVRLNDGSQLPQPEAVQDTASQFVELSHRFSTGREALKVGTQVRVWLARPMGMALWTYDVIAEETLETPEFGPLQAFRLRPRPIANPRGVITAEIWFAPSLQYLPVRVRISLGAENFVDLLVERIEQGAAPTPGPPTNPTSER